MHDPGFMPPKASRMKRIAFLIVILYAALWLAFGVFSMYILEKDKLDSMMTTGIGCLGLVFFGLIAWWLPRTGGIILLVHGLLFILGLTVGELDYPLWTRILVALVTSAPLLIAGSLFFIDGRRQAKLRVI
jgi:hypothetical protein